MSRGAPYGDLDEAARWAEKHLASAQDEIHYRRYRASMREGIASLWDDIAQRRHMQASITRSAAMRRAAGRAWRNAGIIRASPGLAES